MTSPFRSSFIKTRSLTACGGIECRSRKYSRTGQVGSRPWSTVAALIGRRGVETAGRTGSIDRAEHNRSATPPASLPTSPRRPKPHRDARNLTALRPVYPSAATIDDGQEIFSSLTVFPRSSGLTTRSSLTLNDTTSYVDTTKNAPPELLAKTTP